VGFLVRNCSNSAQSIITDTVLTDYLNRIIVLEEHVGICWEVIEEVEGGGTDVTVTDCFFSCEDCSRIAYLLTDCTDRLQPIYTTQDFSEQIGSIVKVPYYDNSCFVISAVPYDNTQTYYEIDYSNIYETCEACRQLTTIYPDYSESLCDTEVVDKIKSKYAEAVYQEIISKRFGVKFCCEADKEKWELKNQLIDNDLINFPSPEFPEPYVEPCCIETTNICNEPNRCTPCQSEEPVEEPCPCSCEASVDSPHDCHTYSFTITSEMLADATGNDNTTTNNRVYFGYIPCGGIKSVTNSYTTGGEGLKEICVLGTPILGWYKDNEWVDHTTLEGVTLTRGVVCEEDINECNTCN
jgi:hypothetical protein